MASGQKEPTMPNSDPYADEGDVQVSTPSETPGDEEQEPTAEEQDDSASTALLPKSIFGKEMKPGDKEQIEIVHVYEDEYEVKCSYSGDEKPATETAQAESRLDKLAM